MGSLTSLTNPGSHVISTSELGHWKGYGQEFLFVTRGGSRYLKVGVFWLLTPSCKSIECGTSYPKKSESNDHFLRFRSRGLPTSSMIIPSGSTYSARLAYRTKKDHDRMSSDGIPPFPQESFIDAIRESSKLLTEQTKITVSFCPRPSTKSSRSPTWIISTQRRSTKMLWRNSCYPRHSLARSSASRRRTVNSCR